MSCCWLLGVDKYGATTATLTLSRQPHGVRRRYMKHAERQSQYLEDTLGKPVINLSEI